MNIVTPPEHVDGVLVRAVLPAAVGVLAVIMRLVPVLRGGGLFGLGNYDDGVHFAAALGLVHGRLPYRDFLLLHPPGIVVALAPFAAVSGLIGDAHALAVARVAFMAVGALNAILILHILRPVGTSGAVVGAGFYAVFFPAVYIEHSTQLEGLATTCVLGAVLIITRSGPAARTGRLSPLIAGVLLGASSSIKIWGVVAAVALAVWALVVLGRRGAMLLVAGCGLGAALICLPFFIAAPTDMWRMVVLDQLGRPQTSVGLGTRVRLILGLNAAGLGAPVWIAAAGAAVIGCALIAWRSRLGRLAVVLLIADTGLLLATPPFFQHYAGLTAAPLALVVGSATALGIRRIRSARLRTWTAIALVLAGTLLAIPSIGSTYGRVFPAATLRPAVLAVPGCVTADDPTALLQLDVLSRNLERGCRLVVDLGGYSYDLQPRNRSFVSRRSNLPWQRAAIRYLGGGSVTMVLRFTRRFGFDPLSAATVRSWTVIKRAQPFLVRDPR
ncbi:MAG: hypothetical protein ACR2LI_03315 [Propionibacteriaceae bacterium]